MKIVRRVLAGIGLVLVAVLLVVIFWGGHVVKQSVNLVGPQVLGVPVELDHARFYPLRGYISLSGLTVGNPEGFKTDSLFSMRHLEVDLDMRSLLTDTIIVRRIIIERPEITYEIGLGKTNLGALLGQLESAEAAPKEPKPDAEPTGPAKTVIIQELVLAEARAQVSATALGGSAVPVQLGTIRLTDLGGPDQSVAQIMTQVMKALVGAVGNSVAGAGDLLGDGLKAALGGVGALGGAAVDGAKAVTGAAADGAKAVTDTIGAGLRGLGGLVVGNDKEEE